MELEREKAVETVAGAMHQNVRTMMALAMVRPASGGTALDNSVERAFATAEKLQKRLTAALVAASYHGQENDEAGA